MIQPPDGYNVLNGFKRPEDAINGVNNLDNQLYIYGTIDANGDIIGATALANVVASNNITVYSFSDIVAISGMALIVGGTGFPLSLGAPQPGCLVHILLSSITSGSVNVKLSPGVTYDGVNNNAIFDAVNDELIIGYKSPTQWQIFKSNSVTFNFI